MVEEPLLAVAVRKLEVVDVSVDARKATLMLAEVDVKVLVSLILVTDKLVANKVVAAMRAAIQVKLRFVVTVEEVLVHGAVVAIA